MNEIFKMPRKIDLAAIAFLAVIWVFVTSIAGRPNSQLAFMASLLITTIFISFTALLIKRTGAVFLFYLIGSVLAINTDAFAELGIYKVPVLLIAGIIFEAFLMLLKIKISNIPLDVVLGAAFSNFSIPFAVLLFISHGQGLAASVWNFAIMAFFIGIIGAIGSFLFWYNVKGSKPIIKFEYSL